MTRIGNFELYGCPKCQKIHRKSNYSSISLYGPPLEMTMPPDAYFAPTELKTCQGCGVQIAFSQYIPLGSIEPLSPNEQRIDPRKLFPPLTD